MSYSYIYRGRAESDILFTSSGNSIYSGHGIGGRQVATVCENKVYLGIGSASTPLAELHGDAVMCPYSRTKLGLIRNGQFYDGYGGGSPLLTLMKGGDIMTLVAAAALTIDDKDLYDCESGRRYSNANEHGSLSHRQMVYDYADSRYYSGDINSDKKEVAGLPFENSDECGECLPSIDESKYRSDYICYGPPERYMVDEDGNNILLNMPNESSSLVYNIFMESRFEQRYRNVDIRVRRLWGREDIENFKKFSGNDKYDSAEDFVNARYIQRVKADIKDSSRLNSERALRGMNEEFSLGDHGERGKFYLHFSLTLLFLSLMFATTDIGGRLFLFPVLYTGAMTCFFFWLLKAEWSRSAGYSYVTFKREPKSHMISFLVTSVAFSISWIDGCWLISVICLFMSIIALCRFFSSVFGSCKIKIKKNYDGYYDLHHGKSGDSHMKGKLDNLKNVIGDDKYSRLANM